jgi:EAL domain-containing protein (putative c-di-GMP-specific phosphodiesterase class I)
MYQAKVQGKGSSQLFHPAMNMRAAQRMTLESALREAIEKDELQLHYQPQIEIRSGTIVSVEALLRWRNPDLGIVHPGEFIALAEKTGLIVLLGDWVLRTALRDAIRWQAAGLPETAVAINVSPHQLAAGHFLSTFIAQLEQSQIDPSLLEIELTESVLVEGSHASTGLWQLAERGVKLVIDDFGTGCSSMSCFRQLPLSHLKIDGSFIHAAIATGVITSAHNLGLIVAAEGVERPEDLEALRAHRCDRAQGFLLGNPMPVEQLLELSRTPALKTAAQVVPLYANARGG